MLNSIEDFRIISSIYRTLSLTVSSEEFNISPASMSKKLKAIEATLGKRLFNRSTRELSPTEYGEIYYQYSCEILEKINSFEDITQIEPEGVIKFSTSTTFARLYLMPVIDKFVKKYPKIKIDLILSDQIVDIIKEGIDLAIRIAPLKDSTLISRRIGNGAKVICASKEYIKNNNIPKTPADLKTHNCLVLGNDSNWTFKKGKKEHTVKVKGNFKVNYGEMIVQAVESGLGISILALWHVHEQIKKGKIVTLLDDYDLTNQAEIYLVYPENKQLANKTRVFIDFLVKELKLPFK